MRITLAILAGLALAALKAQVTLPSKGGDLTAWRTYAVNTRNVRAGDLSPDSRYVALLTATGHGQDRPFKIAYSDYLEVWDFRQAKLIAKKELRHETIVEQGRALEITGTHRDVRYSPDGRYIVASDAATIHVLSAKDCSEIRQIHFDSPALPQGDWAPEQFAVSPDSMRVLIGLMSKGYQGEIFRIYAINSGLLEAEWNFNNQKGGGVGWTAWSPDGRKLAVAWMPVVAGERLPQEVDNLLVLNPNSGEKLLGINTGYLAGPVVFGSHNTIMTAARNPYDKTSKNDAIRIWDAGTGRLLREIANPPTGVHDHLSASANGQIVLGYIGRFKIRESAEYTVYHQFRLWRVSTGEVIATSPEIPPFDIEVSEPQLELSAKGDLVLLWMRDSSKPPVVYEVP